MCKLFIFKSIPSHVYSTQPFSTLPTPFSPGLLSCLFCCYKICGIQPILSIPRHLSIWKALWTIFYSFAITFKQWFFLPFKFILRYTAHSDLKYRIFLTQNLYKLIDSDSSLCFNNLSRLINITYKPKIFKDSWNLFFKLCVRKFIWRAQEAIKKSEDL